MADDDELDLDSEESQVLDPNIRRELREGRKTRAKLEAEAAQYKREAAFSRAGVDLDSPLGKMFAKGYEGDASIEAIKSAAEDIPGLLPVPPPDPNAMSAEELATHKQMAGASGGEGAGGPDLRTQFEADMAEIWRKGGSIDDVMQLIDQADPSLGVVRKGMQ
jgi:hypothetical protein